MIDSASSSLAADGWSGTIAGCCAVVYERFIFEYCEEWDIRLGNVSHRISRLLNWLSRVAEGADVLCIFFGL